jgi:Flp pilus assembly protein TadG
MDMKRLQNGRRDRGAQLVEFALLLPLLLLLILGMVEFGFLFGEFNETRHGVHEGARLAAVNDASLLTNTCNAMDLANQVDVEFFDSPSGSAGEIGTVTITATLDSLSGLAFIEVFLPSTITESADFKLEQDSSLWGDSTTTC